MEAKFIPFVIKHWPLWVALVIIIALIIFEEMRSKLSGLPSLSAQELTQKMNHDEGVVIDIRDKQAFESGHILGSLNVPLSGPEPDLKKLDVYKDKTIIIIHNGTVVPAPIIALAKNGYKMCTLAGGLTAWREAGLPLNKK